MHDAITGRSSTTASTRLDEQPAALFDLAIRQLCAVDRPDTTRVLDLGCGMGKLVEDLAAIGYDACGCDVKPHWQESERSIDSDRFALITLEPYALPFDDESLDVVVSTSVLEHAQNTEEVFREIHRVLRPGGYAIHLLPGKWYLPSEPHIFVPLVNFMWPHCPSWWLGLWAWLGVRNEFQSGMSWREVWRSNVEYCRTGLIYLSNSAYDRLSMSVFGNYLWPMEFYIANGYGGVAALARRLPFPRVSGWLSKMFRMSMLVNQKREG